MLSNSDAFPFHQNIKACRLPACLFKNSCCWSYFHGCQVAHRSNAHALTTEALTQKIGCGGTCVLNPILNYLKSTRSCLHFLAAFTEHAVTPDTLTCKIGCGGTFVLNFFQVCLKSSRSCLHLFAAFTEHAVSDPTL